MVRKEKVTFVLIDHADLQGHVSVDDYGSVYDNEEARSRLTIGNLSRIEMVSIFLFPEPRWHCPESSSSLAEVSNSSTFEIPSLRRLEGRILG